jgi:N-acetylmuramoyl-L-alanine amidase-like protein
MPKVRVRRLVGNKSSRKGTRPMLIVVHSTEGVNVTGLADLRGLGGWFDNPESQVSSHVATDAEGNSARYVRDEDKAWHCLNYNRVSLGIEQVGKAKQTSWSEAEQRETARWIAYWSLKFGIPIHRGKVDGGRVTRSGVIRHSELGQLGGGHSDPGSHFPLSDVLDFARHYRELMLSRR